MSEMIAIKIENVSYSYDYNNKALQNINLDIIENDFVAIIGKNGAGKSTLLKNITGLLRPQSGKISMYGKDNRDISVSRIADTIGFVLQNPDRQLFADTVEKEVIYGLKNKGLKEVEIHQRLKKVLDSVGLSDKKDEFPPALSKGDRAKVIIASVLAMDPQIIIFDEPTSGQDYRGCYQIMDIARDLHEQGRTVIFVTHHMALVAEYAKRVIVMGQSKILMDGEPEDIFVEKEMLLATGIHPPQIIEVAVSIRNIVSFEKNILSVEELGEKLMMAKKNRACKRL